MRLLASSLLCALALSSTNACACINDRDSDALAVQAQKLPDALRVITGRFERNPPRFYQMRAARVQAELAKSPRNFALYDDLGASLDRLNRSDEALQTMNRKRDFLPLYNAKDSANKEAWYRFYANAGTFRAHKWLHDGAQSKTIDEMKAARAFIKRAIEIKPDAHFGREKYQLMAMDWILSTKAKKTDKSLGEWISARDDWEKSYKSAKEKAPRRGEAVEGLSGLIVLGAAWQSVDVFEALGQALESKDGVALRYFALLRFRELLENGGKSLADVPQKILDRRLSVSDMEDYGVAVNDSNRKTLDELFPKLRREAETFSSTRNAYMNARFEQNQHPDTHPNFWKEWKPAAAPSLDVSWINERQQQKDRARRTTYTGNIVMGLFLTALISGTLWFMKRVSKRYDA